MNIYEATDYRKVLKERVLELKKQSRHYTFQNLAKHCRMQKTYLSRALGDAKTHVSPDQLFLALSFLAFSDSEKEYVTLLYELQRTILPQRRDSLARQLRRLHTQALQSESHLTSNVTEVNEQPWIEYYLDPDSQLTHMFFCIPRFAKNAELIRKHLDLTHAQFAEIVTLLSKLKLITVGSSGYRVLQDALHLPSKSPVLGPYQTLLRMKSLERVRKRRSKEDYGFSAFFSATPEVRVTIHREFLQFLKKVDRLVKPAASERVYQMNFDLLDWSSGPFLDPPTRTSRQSF